MKIGDIILVQATEDNPNPIINTLVRWQHICDEGPYNHCGIITDIFQDNEILILEASEFGVRESVYKQKPYDKIKIVKSNIVLPAIYEVKRDYLNKKYGWISLINAAFGAITSKFIKKKIQLFPSDINPTCSELCAIYLTKLGYRFDNLELVTPNDIDRLL